MKLSIPRKSTAIFLGVATMAALIGGAPIAAAETGGFAYGNIVINPGSDQAVLTYRTLDAEQVMVCGIETFACDPEATSTPVGYRTSPSGRLAFFPEMSKAGTEVNNIYTLDDGELTDKQTLPITGTVRNIIFTPDERRAVVRTPSALILLDIQNNALLASSPWNTLDFFSFPQISPDGRFVAYYSPARQSAPTRHFRVVDLMKPATYTLSETIDYWDLLSEENMLFQFSPDGRFLLYKDDRHGQPTLYRVELASLFGNTFQGTRLFTREYSVADFILADPNTLIYLANRESPMRFDLYRYDIAANLLEPIADNASYWPPMRRVGDKVFFNRLVSWGSEVVAYDIQTRTINTFPQPKGPFTELRPGTDITLSNGTHGALLLPDNVTTASPLVIWLHGGPYRQAALGYHPYPSYGVYDWMLEELRQSGAVVLKLDYHGSYAHGRPFAESIKGSVGVADVADVFAAINSVKARQNISQTYLMGVSYGGYLALRSLVEQPRSFAGVVSINGVTDWLGLVNSNPNTISAADFDGPLTAENAAFYDRASVLAKVPQLADQKISLIHSRNDSSVSYSQSSVLAGILETAGKNVEFTTLDGENHVLSQRSSAATVCNVAFETMGLDPGDRCSLGEDL